MSGALVGLVAASARGRVRKLVRQLRRPKQLIGAVIGLAWMSLWITHWFRGTGAGAYVFADWRSQVPRSADAGAGLLFALVFGLAVSIAWLVPFGGLGLPLRESELHVLLPAPIGRRDLIRFALLKAQPPLLLSVALLSLLGGSGRPLDQVLSFVAVWIAMTAWDLLLKARGLFLVRQRELSRRAARLRRGALTIGIVGFWAAIAIVLRPHVAAAVAALEGGADPRAAIAAALSRLGGDVALGVLLAPFRTATAGLLATSGSGFALATAAGLGAIVVAEELTVRSRARFEESALARAAETAASPTRRFSRMSARTRRRMPFELRADGEPALAVLWKNLARVSRTPIRRWLALLAIALVAAAAVAATTPVAGAVLTAVGAVLVFWAPFGSVALRNDLRTDLMHVEALRTWPVRGDRLMLAETLSPTVFGGIAGTSGAALVALAAIASGAADAELFGTRGVLAIVLGLLGGLPVLWGVAALASAILNLGAVTFPSWFPLGPSPAHGLAATGQRLVVGFALFFGQMLGLLPGIALVGLAALAQWLLGVAWSAWVLPFWGFLVTAVLATEVVLLSRIAGQVWERLDPSQEILETGR